MFTVFKPPAFVTGARKSSNSRRKSSAVPLPIMTKEEIENLPRKVRPHEAAVSR